MSDLIVAPETRDLDELAAALESWLAGKMPQASEHPHRQSRLSARRGDEPRDHPVRHALAPRAASSARRAASCGSSRARHTVFPDDLFDQQIQLMQVMHEGGYVRVAKMFWVEQDPSILGKPVLRHGEEDRPGAGLDAALCQHRLGLRSHARAAPQDLGGRRDPARADPAGAAGQGALPRGPAHAREGLAQEWDKYVRFVEWVEGPAPPPRSCAPRSPGSRRCGRRTSPKASSGATRGSAT